MKEISDPNYFALMNSYMKISNIIEEQLIQNVNILLAKGGPKSFHEYNDIIDLIDAYTYALYKYSEQAFSNGYSYNAVMSSMKAIANRIPFRYSIGSDERALGGLIRKLQEIPRPNELVTKVSIKPTIDPLKLPRVVQRDQKSKLVADLIRYSVDLIWFIECYSSLARSLMQIGSRGRHVKFMIQKGHEAEFTNNVQILVSNVFPSVKNVFQLLNVCFDRAEQLQIKDVKRLKKLRMVYGPIKFDLGYLYYTYGLYNDAIQYLTEAIDIYQGRNSGIPKPPNAEIGIADCYLYMGGCEARLGDMGKAREYLMAALEISSKAGITDNIPKVNDIFIKSIMKPALDKEIIIELKIQAERLKRSNPRIIARVKKLLEMYAQVQKKKGNDSAAIYAEEIVKLRELDRVILKSQYSLEKVIVKLEAVKEIGDVMGVLGPAVNIVQQIQGELKDAVPEIAGDLAKVDEKIDTLLTEAGTLTGETIDISAFDEEARKVIQEAHEITSQMMKAMFPELPDDIKSYEKSNAIS